MVQGETVSQQMEPGTSRRAQSQYSSKWVCLKIGYSTQKKMPFPKTHVANSRKCVSFQCAELQDCAFHIGKQYSSHESVRPGEKLITPSGQRCRKQKLKQLENDIENGNQAR